MLKRVHFIINGEDVFVPATREDTMRTVRDEALADSYNTGRPADEWELRDTYGTRIDPDVECAAYFGSRVFLTLQIGAGG